MFYKDLGLQGMKTPGNKLSLMGHTKLDSSWVDYMLLLYFSVASLQSNPHVATEDTGYKQ